MPRFLLLSALLTLLAAPASAHGLPQPHAHPHGLEVALGLIAFIFAAAAGLLLRGRFAKQRKDRK